MSTTISEQEHGVVRVFHVTPPTDGTPRDPDISDLVAALGVTKADAAHIQRVVIADLGDLSLSDFLSAGYAIPADQLEAHRTALDGLEGIAFVMRSSAVPDRPATLKTDGAAKLIATLQEPGADVQFEPLPDAGRREPEPTKEPAKKKPSDAAMSGRVATIALLVMAALVVMMVMIAG